MNVLLINPPSRFWLFPPLGLAYVGAVLRQEGHTVRILDMTAEPNRGLGGTLSSDCPDMVGITCTSQTFQSALEVAERVKAFSKEIKVIFGGSHPSSMPEETLLHEDVDAVVCGEGEKGILELMNGSFTKTVIKSEQMDINKIPLPARELLPMELYETAGSILTSRGCPFRCNYCVHHVCGYKWRGRKPEDVVREIELLAYSYHLKDIHVVDDNFSFDVERAKQIMRLVVDKQLDLKFWFFNGLRADRVDEELIQLMKQANTSLISFGLESADEQVRKNIGKGVTLEQTAKALQLVHDAGIQTRVSVMVGNVGDTFDTVMKTINWVRKNENIDQAEFCLCTAYAGTPLHDWVIKNGRMLANPEDQSTYSLDKGSPSFDTTDFPAAERIRALRAAQAMVFRKNALRHKSILNFKIQHLLTYISTAEMIILKKAPAIKYRKESA